MNRIAEVNQRYAASTALAGTGVEVVAVGDPAGAQLNAAVRQLLQALRDDGPDLWDDLAGAANGLRWRLVTRPQPLELNEAVRAGVDQVRCQVRRLRGAVTDTTLLDALEAGVDAVAASDPRLGTVLLQAIEEAGFQGCVVVAASQAAKASLLSWLDGFGIKVVTAGELQREDTEADHAYVVGPPAYFPSSLVTAPVTAAVSFFLPSWFHDRTVPTSVIARYAEGAIKAKPRIFLVGVEEDPLLESTGGETAGGEDAGSGADDILLPQPKWEIKPREPDREPRSDEVRAHKVLLSGGKAIWLDDGDRIRALDPAQPAGERVIYAEVDSVRPGSYLLLRTGETERGVLYHAALDLLGVQRDAVEAAQRAWKGRLADNLVKYGAYRLRSTLEQQGVHSAYRARAWIDPNVVRPHRDRDFEILLKWLGISVQPTFGYATLLRRALYQASTDVREKLEEAVSAVDLTVLERDGHLRLDHREDGYRGIFATRVLAISPYTANVLRRDARVPFDDRSGQWLE